MQLDSPQIAVKNKLDNLLKKILENQSSSQFLERIANFFKFESRDHLFHGFYIYGGVGRGKTFLMKNFYEQIHFVPKNYFHFNAFMTQIHEKLHEIRQHHKKYPDELHEALRRIILNSQKKILKIICFDEFQVVDVADAMLLARIFEYFFHHKIIVIITSNIHPLELYPNGLQRDLFLRFVNNILLKNIEVLNLDSNTDYRLFNRTKITKKYFVSNSKNRQIFNEILQQLVKDIPRKIAKIKVWGREIKIKKSYKNIAVFDFEELFLENYSSADYRAICNKYQTIFLKKIPQFSPDNINEIRRFTLFIDEAYEQKIMIIFLAKNNLKKLEEITQYAPYFARTISRIHEIIADNYK